MAQLTERSTGGTIFFGSIIATSVTELREKLGDPQFEENDGSDKVNFEWDCETTDGEVFTIYDWKEYREISESEEIHFHIGAFSPSIATTAVKELKKLLK